MYVIYYMVGISIKKPIFISVMYFYLILLILLIAVGCVVAAMMALAIAIKYIYLGVRSQIKKYNEKHSINKGVKDRSIIKTEKTMAKLNGREAFEDAILEVGYLRDYNYRFIAVEDKAYELLSLYHDPETFLDDVLRHTAARKDYVSEILWYVATMVKGGVSSDDVDEKLRPYFIHPHYVETPKFIPQPTTAEPTLSYQVTDTPALLETRKSKEEEFARKSKEHYEQLKQRCEAILASGKTFGEDYAKAELMEFKNIIYHVKLLGHEDKRFVKIALHAHNLITEYGTSSYFYDDVETALSYRKDFESDVIVYIIRQKRNGVSDPDVIKQIRQKFLPQRETVEMNPFTAAHTSSHQVKYVDVEISEASKVLRAKAKIAHKHRATRYANIIGGELAEEYKKSSYTSICEFLKENCKGMFSKGDY